MLAFLRLLSTLADTGGGILAQFFPLCVCLRQFFVLEGVAGGSRV
jgi:hypothetical protein